MKHFYAITLWTLILSQVLIPLPAEGAEPDSISGWDVKKVTEPGAAIAACVATWTNEGPAELSILAEGPLLQLLISAPALERDKREGTVSLRTAGLGELKRQAVVISGTYGITIDNDVDAYLEQKGPLVVTIKKVDYSFSLANAPAAIDAVRRCVGEPTKKDMQTNAKPTFPVPEGWEPLVLAGGCSARMNGNEIDTMVSVNNDDKVLLIAGRKDWNSPATDIKLTLQFDSQPPRPFKAMKWNNLVLLLLVDDKDVKALRKASVLRWHLPSGDYSANVHDVGPALDAAAACTKQKRASAGH